MSIYDELPPERKALVDWLSENLDEVDERLSECDLVTAKRIDKTTDLIHWAFKSGWAARDKSIAAALAKRDKQLRECVALLNCMVKCGESHSPQSDSVVRKALDALKEK